MYILPTFTLSMLPPDKTTTAVTFKKVTLEEVQALHAATPLQSAIPDATLIGIIGPLLNTTLPTSDLHVLFNLGIETEKQHVLVQLRGPILPEGATTLPDTNVLEWYLVTLDAAE